jgi:hypothetical protein
MTEPPPITTIHHRADEGRRILALYREITETMCDPMDQSLTLMLTGLMHYCDRERIDFNKALRAARRRYKEEVGL